MPILKAKVSKLENGCGVLNVCRFHIKPKKMWKNHPELYGPFQHLDKIVENKNNAGWLFASFAIQEDFLHTSEDIQWNKDQKKAFEWLSKRFPIVFKSEVRENKNSGNDFFFAVFDILNPFKGNNA